MRQVPGVRLYRVTVGCAELPPETYEILGGVEGDATTEAKARYIQKHGLKLVSGPSLECVAEEINA